MQLAYSNAQSLVDLHSDRELIIDASVYGMGRGAGNLNTELFVQYLNDNADGNYDIKPLLSIIDEILNEFYQRNYWGYSLPNYLSASHNAHPNYAGFMANALSFLCGLCINLTITQDDPFVFLFIIYCNPTNPTVSTRKSTC